MIQNLSDAKRLVADMHNSILESLERKDTILKRETVDLLRDLFEEKNYNVQHQYSDEIEYKSEEICYDDWSKTGKYPHKIYRSMTFIWEYKEEDDKPEYIRGWNVKAIIGRHEIYGAPEGVYSEDRCVGIYWSVSQKKCGYIHRVNFDKKFDPKKWY